MSKKGESGVEVLIMGVVIILVGWFFNNKQSSDWEERFKALDAKYSELQGKNQELKNYIGNVETTANSQKNGYEPTRQLLVKEFKDATAEVKGEFEIMRVRQATLEKKIIGLKRETTVRLEQPLKVEWVKPEQKKLIEKAGITKKSKSLEN